MSKNLYKKAMENLQIPADLNEKTINFLQSQQSIRKTKINRIPTKRFIIIAAAVMLSLTMLVSATIIAYNIYNGMYMLPGMGLFDGFNENVRTIPKVLTLGDTTIEMAMTYNKAGVHTFTMVIYAKGNNVTGPKPQEKDYENLEITFVDGTSIPIEGWIRERGWGDSGGHYTFSYGYDYENFPDECEFTVTNNAGESIKIELLPIAAKTMKITDNGIKRIKMIPAAEGSKIFPYNVEIIKPSVLESKAKLINYIVTDGTAYSKDGTELPFGGGGYNTGVPVFSSDDDNSYVYRTSGEMSSRQITADDVIDKIIIERIWVNFPYFGLDDIIVSANLPMLKDGERFDYSKPLEVAKIGEFTFLIDAIERDSDKLLVYTSERCVKYSGNENLSDIQFGFGNSKCDIETPGEWNFIHTITLPENYSDDMFEVPIASIQYWVNGHWEIDFE